MAILTESEGGKSPCIWSVQHGAFIRILHLDEVPKVHSFVEMLVLFSERAVSDQLDTGLLVSF